MAEPVTPGSPEVASALVSFSSGGDFAEASLRLYRALDGAKVLVAATGTRSEGDDGDPLDVRLVAQPDSSGRPRLLMFSSERSFLLAGQTPPFAVAPAADLFAFALRHGVDHVSIDSGGPVSASLERWELEALAEGQLPKAPRRGLSMRPVEPGSVPGLVEELGEIFAPGSVVLLEEHDGDVARLLLGLASPVPLPVEELVDRMRARLTGSRDVSLLRVTADELSELRRAGVEPLP